MPLLAGQLVNIWVQFRVKYFICMKYPQSGLGFASQHLRELFRRINVSQHELLLRTMIGVRNMGFFGACDDTTY